MSARTLLVLAVVWPLALPASTLVAQEAGPAVDRLSAAFAAQEQHDGEAGERIDAQIELQEYIRWQSGLPDRRLYFGYNPERAGFYGGVGPLAPRRGGLLWWWHDDGVFEPWPAPPGDIYGYRLDFPIEQPVGSATTWTGPNSYVYAPVYDRPSPEPPPPPRPVAVYAPEALPADPPPRPIAVAGDVALSLAVEAFRGARYSLALERLAEVLAERPDHGPAELVQAQTLFGQGRYAESAAALRRALGLLPQAEWGLVVEHYGDYYPRRGRYTGELRALENASEARPADPDLALLLGYHYAYLGYPDESAAELERALRLAPEDAAARSLLERVRPAAPVAADGPREF